MVLNPFVSVTLTPCFLPAVFSDMMTVDSVSPLDVACIIMSQTYSLTIISSTPGI